MKRLAAGLGPACGLVLLLFFYRSVLFQGGQFSFRDASHFYYPLYFRVQQEWQAGRLPLWDASENAGMPLLGNPTAAVLYPGKLIYAAFSYPWANRLYAIAHTALAFFGMVALVRSWGVSREGSALSGLAYAFGGPVLFQYCNVIFLVGASWMPWGLLAVDRWLRLGRVGSLGALAVVLALQVVGGDPEAAYLVGLCAGGYAVGLARADRGGWSGIDRRVWVPLALLGLVAWVGICLVLASKLPGFRPLPGEKPWGPFLRWHQSGLMPKFQKSAYEGPVPSLPWASTWSAVVAGVWGVVGLAMLGRWWKRRRSSTGPKRDLVPMLAGLLGSAALAGALSAAQLIPATEFTGLTARATDEGNHDIYPFSTEPYRLVEFAWPGAYGRSFGRPVIWSDAIFPHLMHRPWVPSLYVGGLTLVLALGAIGARVAPSRQRGWMVGILAVSLIGAVGEYGSPIMIARFVPRLAHSLGDPGWSRPLVDLLGSIGPHDAKETNAVRLDGYLRDGDGSPYSLMALFLPGFQQFRFPGKLLTPLALALAALAGIGWDRAVSGPWRGLIRRSLLASASSLLLLAFAYGFRVRFGAILAGSRHVSIFGPLRIGEALFETRLGLAQGAAMFAAAAGLVALARRNPGLAGRLALLVMTLDLASANYSLVRTASQADLDSTPRVLKLIEEAEKLDPAPGPYRIHRMPLWNLHYWATHNSEDRIRDFVRWEHDTIQPKYGLLHGVEYTYTVGTAELYDFLWFFSPFPRVVRGEIARRLDVDERSKIVVYPRRGFDLWNSRYFIVPGYPIWGDPDRGIASFLPRAERIYPKPEDFPGRWGQERVREWMETEDFQIFRNLDAYPRAWIVHDALVKPPIHDLKRASRRETMEDILFANDPFWEDYTRPFHDTRKTAWVEVEDPSVLNGYIRGGSPLAGDSVRVVVEESNPQKVVLDANLAQPGLVILADIYFPGWKLTIDGKPTPILRANRAMRGAAVPSGKHRLVYTYEPRSVRLGIAVSIAGMVALAGFSAWSRRRGRPAVAPA